MALTPFSYAQDEHSYANADEVRISHLYLDAAISFPARSIEGFVDLDLKWATPQANALVLDTRDLRIDRVLTRNADGEWKAARFTLGSRDDTLGQKLTIAASGQPAKVRVHYASSPEASGLQWLQPQQTAGKRQPFMFSQSQAIHARSWVPLQDTPAVRFSYSARIRTEPGLRAVMSADNALDAAAPGDYRFSMPQPIPSYLMAIAAGELAVKPMSARTAVFAEPELIDAAVAEFADTERMIEIAEQLYGPYRWDRYDLLILPPSFPFGGMENPRLSFITPTVIAGDRSLVSLIAHELAHSWSGNLVTNARWKDLWLNEGFTTYVEYRIMEAVYGRERAEMELVLGDRDLREELKEIAPADQRLALEIDGRDPDEVFSGVPYNKGQWFLRFLEQRFGRARFDAFLRNYFDAFAFKSITTETFMDYLDEQLLRTSPGVVSAAEINAWVNEPGIPDSAPASKSVRFNSVAAHRERWLKGEISAVAMDAGTWSTQEWLFLLNSLPQPLDHARLTELDAAYRLTGSRNGEIAFAWYKLAITSDYRAIREGLSEHLIRIGRRKLIVPLYEELARRPEDRGWALKVYEQARPGYHPITQGSVDKAFAEG